MAALSLKISCLIDDICRCFSIRQHPFGLPINSTSTSFFLLARTFDSLCLSRGAGKISCREQKIFAGYLVIESFQDTPCLPGSCHLQAKENEGTEREAQGVGRDMSYP